MKIRKIWLAFLLLLGLRFSVGEKAFAADADGASHSSSILAEADAAFQKREDPMQALTAMELYEKAGAQNDSKVECYWKSSRLAHWIGDHSSERKEKLIRYQQGIDAAQKALELKPDSVEAHFWLAANYGSFGEAKGILKSLALLKPIRQELNTVVKIDDKYAGGGGYRVLGIVDYKVPGFAGGKKKEALQYLTKALSIDPHDAANHYYMAEFYSVIGDNAQARQHLDFLKSITSAVDMADLRMFQEKGETLQKKLR